MQVKLKMWTPKGTMVEVAGDYDAKDAAELTYHITEVEADMLRHGFTSQRPDHTYPTKEQVIEGVVVVGGTDFNGNPQSVLYLYTDNRALEYSEYRIYPEDEWYPKLTAMLDMDNVISGQPPRKGDMHKPTNQKAWQQVGRKATFVPARNKDGHLVFRKNKQGELKSWPEYKVRSVEGFAATSTNGNHAATNGTQIVRKGEPTAAWSLTGLVAWAEDSGACDNSFEATNSLKKMVRELFDVKQGQEKLFLQGATPDKIETLKLAYIAHQQDKLDKRMMHVVAANNLDDMEPNEELPF